MRFHGNSNGSGSLPPSPAVQGLEPLPQTGRFSMSFASTSVQRSFEGHIHHVNQAPVPPVRPTQRTDLDMRSQLLNAAEREAVHHQDWVQANQVNVARSPGPQEKHHLKILIRSAVLRQRDQKSTKLSSVILSRSAAAPAHNKKKHVTKEQAFDLDFVVKKLMEDIDIVYRRHGYKTTLQAFVEMYPWEV